MTRFAVFVVVCLMGSAAFGQGTFSGAAAARIAPASPEDSQLFTVEFKQVKGENIGILHVTFKRAVSKQNTASILKNQLQRYVKLKKPTQDVMAYAWNSEEDMILPSGDNLIYVAKQKKTMKLSEYKPDGKKQ